MPRRSPPELTFSQPGTTALRFIPDPNYRVVTDNESWIAEWDGWRDHEPAFRSRDGYYRVWEYVGKGWDAQRPDHPILGKFSGRWSSRQYAMQACAEDFAVVERLWRWHEHMKNHEPPEVMP